MIHAAAGLLFGSCLRLVRCWRSAQGRGTGRVPCGLVGVMSWPWTAGLQRHRCAGKGAGRHP